MKRFSIILFLLASFLIQKSEATWSTHTEKNFSRQMEEMVEAIESDGIQMKSARCHFDDNGNLLNDGTRAYSWDTVNRLVAIVQGTRRTEFIYDGFSRRIRIVEKDNSVVTSDKRFLWDGMEIVEERDSMGATVTKRYFDQGVQIGSAKYFYTRDHLGSIRELVDNVGNVVARYDYDLYGKRTLVSGTDLADFGFTGHYYHKPSGLHLTLYRAYSAIWEDGCPEIRLERMEDRICMRMWAMIR